MSRSGLIGKVCNGSNPAVPPIEDERRRECGGDAAFRPVEIPFFRHLIDCVLYMC